MGRRPFWVWVISISFLLSTAAGAISEYLVYSGAIPIDASNQLYFASSGPIDWIATAISTILTISAAISLFMLRRIGVLLLIAALSVDIALSIWEVYSMGFGVVYGGTRPLMTALIGWAIRIVIIVYCWHLAKKKVLT